MPEIIAGNNVNYGGNLINTKYSPLVNINVDGLGNFYRDIFNERIAALADTGLFPKKLNLYAKWSPVAPVPAVAPVVVISSKRAWWLRTLFRNMETYFAAHGAPAAGYNTANIFSEGAVPWYSPRRSGRLCYIVVNKAEYDYYVGALKDAEAHSRPFANVTIVGYEYVTDDKIGKLGGFGASRYAALAMAMNLGYEKAWLVDDNVVHINGFPNLLATVEADMGDEMWAIGFKGATDNIPEHQLYGDEINYVANYDIDGTDPGLLQQAVLWNLTLLAARPLNMSPYFCSSNEDISISNYLQRNDLTQRIVTSCSVIKLQPDGNIDDMPKGLRKKYDDGATQISINLKRLLGFFYGKEANLKINDPGTNLCDYVRNTIIPNSQDQNASQDNILLTESRAIEQTLSKATERGWAPAKVFNPYQDFVGVQVARLMAG